MSEKARPARDAFTFSLGGMRAIASFVAPTAHSGDRINRALDERLSQVDIRRPDRDEDYPAQARRLKLRIFRRAA